MLECAKLRQVHVHLGRYCTLPVSLAVFIALVSIILTAVKLSSRASCCAARPSTTVTMLASSTPPVAARKPREIQVVFGDHVHDIIQDPYAWLRDDNRSDAEVMTYLKAENSYADAYFSTLEPLVDSLATDMDSRLPAIEVGQPQLSESHAGCSYIYYSKRGPGDEYWNFYRMQLPQLPSSSTGSSSTSQENNTTAPSLNLATAVREATQAVLERAAAATANQTIVHDGSSLGMLVGEQLVLNENSLSEQHSYWDVYEKAVSPDGSRVAFTYDTKGDECYCLQVVDITSGKSLLEDPVADCAGGLTWWGLSSSILCYTTRDQKAPDTGRVLVKCLQLQLQQQQQHRAISAVLYEAAEGERALDLKSSSNRQYVILTSTAHGGTKVQAVATDYPLDFSSSSSSSSSNAANVPQAAWLQLITPDDDLDVLKIDHIGTLRSSSSSNSSSSNSNSNSSSSGGGVFVAIVDDDESPDGELVLVTATHQLTPDAADGDTKPGSERHIETIVNNKVSDGETSDNEQQQQQQQQQQQSVEILDFKVHAAAGYMAVAVRRQGVCAIDVYKLHTTSPNSSSSKSSSVHDQGGKSDLAGQMQEQTSMLSVMTVPKVLLLTTSSSSNDKGNRSNSNSSSDYITLPNPASSTTHYTAELSWILVLDQPTLLMDLEGLVGSEVLNRQGLTEQATQNPGGFETTLDSLWLVVQVRGITTPSALYFVNLVTKQQIKVYEERIPGFQAGLYTATLEWVPSADGTAVPLTIACRTELMKKDGTNKAILHGYGAYGSKQWPSFNPADLSVLDQGLVLAVAHVRGGGELGSAWHINGKKFCKKNTFADFLACAGHLVASGYTSRELLAVWGRSAGGLTVAASLNADPGFARVAVLDVPFVDVINTMRDPDLPLTIKERGEWGDPLNSQEAYDYIRSYSPCSNINPNATYPALLLTASLHDMRVNFWEPAKYTAAMRYYKQQQQQQQAVQDGTGGVEVPVDRPVLLMTDMYAGHFAASAASSRLEERAMKLAFILQNLT